MASHEFIEDLYIEIYSQIHLSIDPIDAQPAANFYSLMIEDKPLTEKQAFFALKLLKKYRIFLQTSGLDDDLIDNPVWKHEFRVLDQTKHISLTTIDDLLYLTVKHPYAYKEKFEQEICDHKIIARSIWDENERHRHYPVHDINLVLVKDFADRHGFTVSKEFIEAVDFTERVWEDHEIYEPFCIIENGSVILKNPTESAVEYFSKNQKFNIPHDLMLAKKMGFRLISDSASSTYLTKVCQTINNIFYLKDIMNFFKLHRDIGGKVCVILGNKIDDIKEFIQLSLSTGLTADDVKICFRESNDDPDGVEFNRWVKESNLGGDLKNAKFLIFKSKLPKWLITQENDINIILIRNTIPPSSEVTQRWIGNHHCVIYSDIATPTVKKEQFSVEL